jgi:paraquat-inducible protein B
VFRPSRWPGLIWVVPLTALAIVLWLGVQAYLRLGPTVTVSFATTGGIQAGQTKVAYRGVTVGHVVSVRMSKSLRTMVATLSFADTMKGHLGRGTRFWIAGKTVHVTNLSSLKALIAGPHIVISPQSGAMVRHFVALARPPVLKNGAEGETLTLRTADPGNLSRGAPITLHHYKVGEVLSIRMAPGGTQFDVYAFVARKYEHLINTRSRFWSAGAIRMDLGGGGPSLHLQSVPALLTGAIDVATPGPGSATQNGTAFTLYSSAAAARAAPGPHAVAYRVLLPGGPHGLAAGAKVTLEGEPAGVVTAVRAVYDPTAKQITTHARIALEPRLIPRAAGHPWHLDDPAPQMNAMLRSLIAQGLRARRASAVPVLGGELIALDLVAHVAPAALGAGAAPLIPAVGGAGSGQILARLSSILAEIKALPLPQIAHDIDAATQRLAALSASPGTTRTLARLDDVVARLDAITARTDKSWPTILAEVSRSAREAGAALQATRSLLSQRGGAASGPESATLPQALYELTRAARSLRALSDYLSGHPSAVITGRGR